MKLEIPTVAKKSLKKLEEVIEIEKPDVVINVGQAGGRTDITSSSFLRLFFATV